MSPGFQALRGAASRSAWGAAPSPFADQPDARETESKPSFVASAFQPRSSQTSSGAEPFLGRLKEELPAVSAGAGSTENPSLVESEDPPPVENVASTNAPSSEPLSLQVASSSRPGSVLLSRFGMPSSGRLLPGVRLLSYDPTVEGRVEAFLAECCDASRQTSDASKRETAPTLPACSAGSPASFASAASGSSAANPSAAGGGKSRDSRQDLVVSMSAGHLVGKYTGWKVNLPVALETMLEEHVALDVMFETWELSGSRGGFAGETEEERGELRDAQQRNVLQRLLQRLLQAKRQAYELRPSRRQYLIVDRLKSDAGDSTDDATDAARLRPHHVLRGEEDAEECLGVGRVLRYRLASDSDSEDAGEGVGEKTHGDRKGKKPAESEEQSVERKGDSENTTAGARTPGGCGSLQDNAAVKEGPTARGTATDLGTEGEGAARRATSETTGLKRRRKETRIEVVERIPLGTRLIYRPRSDNHIRLTAESEIATVWTVAGGPSPRKVRSLESPPKEEPSAGGSVPRPQTDSTRDSAAGEESGASGEKTARQDEVVQRSWLTQDVWDLCPLGCPGSPGTHRPRWRLIVTEEGEVADCMTPAATLLLQGGGHPGGTRERRFFDAFPQRRRGSPGGEKPSLEEPDVADGHVADDVDRYEETKKVYVHLEVCGGELQRQLERRKRGQKNVFGALALLVLENAHVLARWLDELNGDFGVGGVGGPFYFPNHMGDVVQAVQKHYNQRKLVSAGQSRIGGLRIHNNQVKRLLINKYVSMGQTVLELACGHGQDLWKYADRCIGKFVGVDLSVAEIREARRRVREGQQARALLQQMLHPPTFHVGNLVDRKALGFLRAEEFDIVSIQLAIHYMVQTEQQARDVLGRAAAHLKEGGMVLGSTVCCSALADHLVELAFVPEEETADEAPFAAEQARRSGHDPPKTKEKCEFGNEVYSVTFDIDTIDRLLQGAPGLGPNGLAIRKEKAKAASVSDPSSWKQYLFADLSVEARAAVGEHLRRRLATEFGIDYHFFLSEAIDAKEFVLPWRSFCAVAASVGLKLVLSMTFPEFLSAATQDPKSERDLKRWLERLNATSRLDKPQFEAFALYKVFAFKKATSTQDRDTETLSSAPAAPVSPQTAQLISRSSPLPQRDHLGASGSAEQTAEKGKVHVHPSEQPDEISILSSTGEHTTERGEAPPSDRSAFLEGVPLKRKRPKRMQTAAIQDA
ncbi:putative mRNA capping enzyme, large subunit family [Neospora caninum Liverpool]|uniref:mRNA (guanine-N(7))-methyltransferase n=1 Tax=Neospora caninum (strain Liverpool) TaxID=572307 RepID=F0VIW7_NEOCL|nr:putative mRNA capping enzyme, large subunit family [Neospora caninum Liverpool]CBZ53678.1 putative mRNA capping enzyme, large subunit family [Neospora caninum Liverpool]CEL67669.1 TPA: mRNA capping enzyme, large subunit family,putative [Neospora caninum Liverpool]|eukprot:XP_003883710.1 putative mRNA capping enzyme, large subunit family [Neospora caninum Liverpool]